jgi:Tfp pilus assembly protein PilN
MADVDMIPRSYRDTVRVRRTLRQTGAVLACVAVLGLGTVGTLRWRIAAVERQATALQAAASQTEAARARDAALQAAGLRLQRADATLQALRREGELDALTRGLEASLGDKVWLTALTLERDAQAAATSKDGTAGGAAGSPTAGPAEGLEELADADGGQPAWRMASRFELQGQAAGYAAVTAFLDALGRQHGVTDLRLVGSNADGDGRTIDFHAAGYVLRRRPQ